MPTFCFDSAASEVKVLDAERRVHCKNLRDEKQIGDRRKVRGRVETGVFEKMLIVGEWLSGHQADRIAIGSGFRTIACCDVECAARLVLDDEGLLHNCGQAFAQCTHEYVGNSARRDRDDHANRPCGIVGCKTDFGF